MSFHNLQRALDYRTECFIHHQPMIPLIHNNRVKSLRRTEEGLVFQFRTSISDKNNKDNHHLLMKFLYDGTMTPQCVHALTSGDSGPIEIHMQCEECVKLPGVNPGIKVKSRSFGPATLYNIRLQCHQYIFNIYEINNSFICSLNCETIKYNDGNKFYHFSTDLTVGSAHFSMGDCQTDHTVDHIVKSTMHLNVPKFDATKIVKLGQLVDKIKLYNLFS